MKSVCLHDAEYCHPPEEGLLPPVEGWLHTLHPKGRETKLAKEAESTARAQGHAPHMKKWNSWTTPKVSPGSLGQSGLKKLNCPHEMLNCNRQYC